MEKKNLLEKFATRFSIDANELKDILKATAFKLPPAKQGEKQAVVSDEQMTALLAVADQYGLNPFIKEIYAFPDKGKGIVPIVGVDGWSNITNGHPQFDGLEFNQAENFIKIDADAKPCPEWIEATIYRKDRNRPTIIREYLDECYRPAFNGQYGKVIGAWQSHTKRFLRHKALIQCARIAFGFAGIYDEDEGRNIIDVPFNVVKDTPDFNTLIEQHGISPEDESLNAFLKAVASQNRLPTDTIKTKAAEDITNFLQSLQNWREKQLVYAGNGVPKEEKSKAKMAEAADPDTPPQEPKADSKTLQKLNIEMGKIAGTRDDKMKTINAWLAEDGQPPITTSKDLTEAQAIKYTARAKQNANKKPDDRTVKCPNDADEDTRRQVWYCDTKCDKRQGCPAFDAVEN